MKAKLMGNDARHDQLMAKVDAAKKALEAGGGRGIIGGGAKPPPREGESKGRKGERDGGGGGRGGGGRGKEEEVVVLTGVDAKGKPLALNYVGRMTDQEKATRDKAVHDNKKADFAKGERTQYFGDDNMSVDEMVRREKMSDRWDYEENMVMEKANSKRKAPERAFDAEEDEYGCNLGNTLKKMEGKDKKMKTADLEERAKRQVTNGQNSPKSCPFYYVASSFIGRKYEPSRVSILKIINPKQVALSSPRP